MIKTNKSYAKRIKVTKNGKLVSRVPGQDHFNAKESRRKQFSKKRTSSIQLTHREKRRFLVGV